MVYIVSGLLEQELIQEVSKQKDVVKIETIQQPKLDGKISVIETIYEI